MATRVVDRFDDWNSRSFTDGHSELSDLAAAEFSGVVVAGTAELYMIRGTAVGVRRGSLEDFEGASGTVYEAPTPALPLLAVMQAADADVRAEYYSEETPMGEVDRTLTDGGFTGYVELSENVLSGDYYLVYHDGKRMAVGFVGNNSRLITDTEAFETADDEVGIYKVRQVEITPLELPAAAADADAAGGAGAGAAAAAGAGADSDDAAEASGGAEPDSAPTGAAAGDSAAGRDHATDTGAGADTTQEQTADATSPAQSRSTGQDAPGESTQDDGEASTAEEPAAGPTPDPSTAAGEGEPSRRAEAGDTSGGDHTGAAAGTPGDLETRAIPSLDPARTQSAQGAGATGGGASSPERAASEAPESGTEPGGRAARGDRQQSSDHAAGGSDDTTGAGAGPTAAGASDSRGPADRVAELESVIADREADIERLEAELAAARSERDDLAAQLDTLRTERDELAAEVERHQSGGGSPAGADTGAATDAAEGLSPSAALEGTDIFVRYRSKEDATLGKAHAGSVSREDVSENLRLETHTQFDAAAVSVDGGSFREFLGGRPEYQFIHWLVTDLLFEIRNTGHAEGLADLYDALPAIDRAELDGTVEVVDSENGGETRSDAHFDVVLRDRMGNPLFVANLNDSREGATAAMMSDLITAAEGLGQASEELAGAFLVTRSFFEPPALETASEATRRGILSRDKRRSFVNISRKRGFHLCLVEARDENFHLTVPEL